MVAKKEEVLAFDVVTRLSVEEVIWEHGEELEGGFMALQRPDLFGFACGVTVDVGTGDGFRFGPFDRRKMLSRLEGADLLVSCNGRAHELRVIGMPLESDAWARHLSIGVDFEYVGYGAGEEDRLRPRYPRRRVKGRFAGLLSESERRARWTAETHRAVRHLERAASPPYRMVGKERAYYDTTNIHISISRSVGVQR